MATITTINATDLVSASRAVINTNFSNLNSAKVDGATALTTAGRLVEVASSGVATQTSFASSVVVLTSGSYADPAWVTSLATTKLTGTLQAAQFPALTGDITTSTGAVATTLANTAVTPASYGSATQVATFTVDSKGRLTAAASTSIAIAASQVTSGTLDNARTTAASTNTVSAIVARDASGNFAAGTITATFSGNLTGNVTGNASGTAATITGALALANTPLTTRGDLLVATTATPILGRLAKGTQYQVLLGGATDPTWGALDLSQASAITGILPVGNGGTGATTLAGAGIVAGAASITTANALLIGASAGTLGQSDVSLDSGVLSRAGTVGLSATGANIVTLSTNGVERWRWMNDGNVEITRPLAGDFIIKSKVTGDATPRLYVGVNGDLVFGPGNAAADVSLGRVSLGNLQVFSGENTLTGIISRNSSTGTLSMATVKAVNNVGSGTFIFTTNPETTGYAGPVGLQANEGGLASDSTLAGLLIENTTASGYIRFQKANVEVARFDSTNQFIPGPTGSFGLGLSTRRWETLYSKAVNIQTVGVGNKTALVIGRNVANGGDLSSIVWNDAGLGDSAAIDSLFSGDGLAGGLTFRTLTSGSLTEKFRVSTGGRVLIGTTTDDGYKVHVNGELGFISSASTDRLILFNSGGSKRYGFGIDSTDLVSFFNEVAGARWRTNSYAGTSLMRLTGTGTLTLYNELAVTGSTSLAVRAGAGQGSAYLLDMKDNSNASKLFFQINSGQSVLYSYYDASNYAAWTTASGVSQIGTISNIPFKLIANDTERISLNGTGIGFFGVTPVARAAALTAADASALTSSDATVIGNMRTRIGELETKLQAYGLLI